MKRLILILLLVLLTACGESKTENKEVKKVTEKKKEVVEVVKTKGDYNIQDLFFYREINNGNLLATSGGLFKEQMERAAVFVPAGGGTESPKFKVVTSEPNHIELAGSGLNIDYYLFNYTKEDAALILISEKGNDIRCIKYSGKSDSFSKENVKNLFPFESVNYSELKIENHRVTAKKDILEWKNDRFLP